LSDGSALAAVNEAEASRRRAGYAAPAPGSLLSAAFRSAAGT
jgi:hypothetical protein